MRRNPFIPREYQQEDYATRYRREHGIADENNGNPNYYDAFFKGAKAQSAGVIGGQADMLEQFTGVGDGVADYMQEVQKSNARGKEYGWRDMLPGASDYWTNPWGAAYDIGGGIGSSATLLGETLLAGKALGAAGLSAVGTRLTKAIGERAVKAGMPWVDDLLKTPTGKALVANVMSTPLEALSEGGNKAREVAERGGSEEEQRDAALQTAGWNMALMPFLNAIESAGLGGLIAKSGGKETFLNTMKGVLGDAVQNTYEEGMQESISEYADNPNGKFTDIVNPFGWSEQAYNAAAVGGVTGAAQGGIGVAGGKAMNAAYDKYFKPHEGAVEDEAPTNTEQENAEDLTNDIPGIARPIVPGLVKPIGNPDLAAQYNALLQEPQQEEQLVSEDEPISINQGLFPKPKNYEEKIEQENRKRIGKNNSRNDDLVGGALYHQGINQLKNSFNPPHIGENTIPKGLIPKKDINGLQENNLANKMPEIQQKLQQGLNRSNMPIGASRNAQEMGKATNLALSARGVESKPKGLFDAPVTPKQDDVNKTADRLMAEQYINQAFDQRQPFMPQGYGSTTRQEQGQLLANLLNARAASEWDKAAGMTKEQRRSNMPFVPQRASMYNGALRRNLAQLDNIKPVELPSISNETTDVNRRAAEIQRLREQVIPQARANVNNLAKHALLEERGKAKAKNISDKARARVREDARLADELREQKHAKERYEAAKNDVIGFILPYKTNKQQMKGVNALKTSIVEQLHEQLDPIYSELVNGMGHGVTDEWVEKGTYIPTDVGDLIGHPETGKNSHTADHLRYSNNAPWYQQWFKRYGRKPSKAEVYQVAEDILTNRGDSWAWPDKMYDGSPEANQYLSEIREDIDTKHDYINACDVVKQELKNGKLFTEADYKQDILPQLQEVQNAQTEKTTESKGNDENSVPERNTQKQADYQGENKDGEAEKVNKKSSAELAEEKIIKETVANITPEKFSELAYKTDVDKKIVARNKEELYSLTIKNIKEKLEKVFSDPLGNNIYFSPGNTETIESYALHLIAGQGKSVDDIRVQRVLGVLLSEKTITKPWAIVRQENGRKMYLAVYRGENNLTNGLVIGVEEGQNGRIVTSTLTADKKGDKKAAIREFKKRISGASEILYIWEGLTGRPRPSADQRASQSDAKLHPSGTNISVPQKEESVKKSGAASVINDYKHTTKKTMIKAAKLDKDFSNDEFKAAKELAEENGGFYSKYASQKLRTKGVFLFEKGGAEGRDAFIAALNEKFGDKQEISADNNDKQPLIATKKETPSVSEEDVQKAEVERVAKEVSKEPSLGMYARKGDQADFVRHYMNVAEDTISELGEEEPLSIDSVSTKELERMFATHMVELFNKLREADNTTQTPEAAKRQNSEELLYDKKIYDETKKLIDTVNRKRNPYTGEEILPSSEEQLEEERRFTLFNRVAEIIKDQKELVEAAQNADTKTKFLNAYSRAFADKSHQLSKEHEEYWSGGFLMLDDTDMYPFAVEFYERHTGIKWEDFYQKHGASPDTFKNNPDALFNQDVVNSSEGQAAVKSVIDKSEKESLKLADGYSVENGKSISEANKDEFILYNGEKNLGRISEDVAENSNGFLQAAPIRLQVGNAEFGLVHLLKHEKQMRDKGFKNVFDFIRHVANNFNRVYSQQTEKKPNRFALYCSEDTSKGLMAVDLEIKKDTDGYYTIVSAMPHKPKIKGTLVYDGSSRPSTVTTDSLLSSDTNNKGGDDAEIVLAKPNVPFSKSSLAQTDEVVKKSESTTPSDEKVVESSQKENSEGGKDNADNNGSLRAVPQRPQADNVQETGSGEQVGGVPEQEVRGSEGVQGRDVRTAERTRPSDRGGLSGESETQQQTVSTSGRTDKRNVAEQGLTPAQQSNAKAEEVPGHNFIIKSSSDVADNGAKTKFKGNIAAITLLKKLEAEGRMATPAEQKVLAKYIGWGPLQEAFNGKRYPDWESEAEELKNLLTPKEWNAARDSVLTAFYTPPEVIKSIYGIVQRLGFKGGRVLDPAMGSGNFFGAMPERLRKKCMLRGVEIETISGGMAKQLYQDASVEVIGYENAYLDNEGYDLVITNVPFKTDIHPVDADFKAWNFNLHNYFFAKSVQKVRPGGLICFITSENTMKSNSKDIRKYLADKVDFIGAIKLPDNTFKSYAGTTVTSDLIILQKRGEDGKPSKYAKEWLRSDTRYLKDAEGKTLYGDINEYYVNNPEMVIGQWARGNYGSVIASGKGLNVSEEIDKLVEAFPKNIYKPVKVKRKNDDTNASTVKYLSNPDLQNGSIVVADNGEIMVKSGSGIVPFGDKAKKGYKKDAKCAGNYVRVRDIAKQLLEKQLNPEVTDEELQGIRNDLNKAYDNFVAEHGPLGANGKLLSSDPDYGLICSIENYSYNKKTKETTSSKTAIFTQRTVNAIKPATSAANENDALLLSLSTKGRLDLEYMQKLLGGKKSQEDILATLGDKVFKDPVSDDYVMADEYLSGNVREKLEHARMAAQTDKSYTKNVKALEKIIPQNLTEKDIHASLGSAWIPAQDIEAFANELMETNKIKVDFVSSTGTWTVDAGYADNNIKGTQIYGTKERGFGEILSAALNQKAITITHDKEVDVKATDLANAMVKKVQDAFEKWIWTDEKRRDRLVNFYNNNFNATVLREYDGSMLTMPGYSAIAPQLRKHQKDAIWRIVQNGTCLLAHCVGAGKTWVMQASAMEQKRLGLINKPMFTIPNHMVEQFTNEFRQIYPNAKLLVLTTDNLPEVGGGNSKNAEVVKANKAQRKATLARIATEDWDGIIISHEIFKRIPMSQKAYEAFYQEQIDELENALSEAQYAEGERSLTVKELVSKLKKAKEKMENLMKVETKDLDTPFDKLGIDQIYVDEADLFKNLSYVTNMTRVSGLSNSNSQRSQDMYIKTQYLLNTHNGRGVVFATGTPISNTIAEMFTMLRYLNPKALKEHGVSFFDTFINTFSKKETTIESKPEGNGYRQVEKFVRFYNMGGLKRMFREVADVKTQADLDIKIPELKNGKRTVTEVPGSKELNQYITREIKKRAEDIHNGNVQPDVDNMLKLTSDMRKATLDMRLLDKYKNLPLEVAAPKLKAVTENVYKKYQESSENKGTQLIFCDLATPKGTSDKELSESANEEVESKEEQQAGVNAYSSIGKELIKMGIPANEIAFIHDAKNDEQKEALFAKVRNGEVRVLIGSTSKMGAGTNIQKRVVAEHHVDCPWRPRDIEQREGRALRQGNMNDEVEIFTYITKGSLDEFMWEKIKNKASMIEQAMNSDLSINTVEDISAEVLSYAEIQGLASGDPFIPKRVTVAAELNSLNNQYREYRDNIVRNKRTIGYNKEFIAENEKAIAIVKEDIKGIKSVVGDDFTIKIDGKTFDKFSEAEEYILDIAENDDRANMHKGSFGGLDFTIRYQHKGFPYRANYFNNVDYTREARNGGWVAEFDSKAGDKCYISAGSLRAMSNLVGKSLDNFVESKTAKNQQYENEIAEAEKALKLPFDQEDKLKELQEEQTRIDKHFTAIELAAKFGDKYRSGAAFQTTNGEEYHSLGNTKIEDTDETSTALLEAVNDKTGATEFVRVEDIDTARNETKYSIAPQTAYHGSNRVFNEFRLSHSKEGHGDLTHGYGVYFSADEEVANSYRKDLSGMATGMEFTIRGENYRYDSEDNVFRGTSGNEISINAKTPEGLLANAFYMTEDADDAVEYLKEQQQKASEKLKPMYQKALELAREGNLVVNPGGATYESLIPSVEEMIDEDATYSEQPEVVKRGIDRAFNELGAQKQLDEVKRKDLYGNNIYVKLMQAIMGDNSRVDETMYFIDENEDVARQASELLDKHGVKGLRYDGEVDGEAFVVFNEKAIEIKRRYEANLERAAQRTREEVLNEVKKALPTAKISYDSKGNLIAEMPNGRKVGVVVEDRILLNQQQAKSAGKAHNTIANEAEGYWNAWEKLNGSDVLGVIHVSRNSRVGTAFHEVLHAAMDLSLTAKEKEALYKHFKKAAEKSGRDIDEEIADGYKDWVLKRQQGQGSLFGKLYKKAVDFLNKLYTMFVNANNVGNTFRKLESGKVWSGNAGNNKNQQYSVTNTQITGETRVPVIDVTGLPPIDTTNNAAKTTIAKSLIGKEFRIIGSNGIGRVASIRKGRHLVGSSQVNQRHLPVRQQAMRVIEDILNNAVYVDKHDDVRHESKTKYIELYAVVKNKKDLTRFRIVAKEGNNEAGKYEVKEARFYDIIKDGNVTADMSRNISPTQRPEGLQTWAMQNMPSTVSVAELLFGVKDKNGKPYVDKYGGLLYEQKAMKDIRASIAQAISSAETSIKQIPAIFKKIPWQSGTVNIDIGGGKFDLATNFVKEKGVENIVFDPFNRDYDHNSKAFEKIKQGGDTVTVANVLNVIAEENARDNVILQAARALKPNGTAYFGIYEGSKDGVGKVTSKGWQNNKKAGDYISEVEKHFNDVRKAGNIIIAKKPNHTADEKAVWSMDDTWQNTVKYSIAPTENKLASTFTNTKRKNIIETFKDWLAEQRKDFYVKWFDKNDRLHDFDKAIEMGVGKKVDESKKVYSRVQTLPATSAGMATALIEGNADHIKVINDRLKHKKLKHNATMQMVLNVINKSKMDKLHPFWLKENGFDSWINALGAYLGSARLLEMSKRAKEEGVEYKLPNGLTSEELMNYIAKAPAEFKRAADLYYKFNDNMLTIMEDAGLISEETHRVLNEKYKHYCPLMRDFSDTAAADAFIGGLSNGGRGIANVSNPLKRIRIEGSERNVFNPLESTLKAVSVICNRAERNKVGQMAVELAQEAGLENVVVEVEGDKADEKNCIFTVMQNGKKQAYQTTQELYGPIVGYNLPAAGLMLGVARSAAHLLRTGATMSPSFILRNLIRDTIFAGISSQNGFVPILDTIRGAQALLNDPKMKAEFETAGITSFNFYNTAEEIAKSLDEMADNKNWREYTPSDIWKALINHPTKPFVMTSEFIESATRMGEFLKARGKGLSIEEAARAARELTLDFSRSGVSGEKYNQVVPFFNACLQGGDKLIRLLKQDLLGTSWKITKYIILPSIILWAFNHDEDWYKELDPEIKNNCWCFPNGVRIPKPQEAGVLFGSGVEALFDIASGKDEKALSNWGKSFLSNMLPSVIPTLFLPILEWQANYSFFRGQNIANRRLQQLPDELQYTNSTSELSKAVGSVTGLSPVKIDNTIRGYTGTMGMFLAQAPDRLVSDKRNLPEKKTSELAFIRDFNITDINRNRQVDEFYDMLADANKQHAGYGKKGKPSKVVKSIRTAGKMISDLNKDIQTITNSRLSPSVKRARIDKKRAEIKRIANIAVTKYGKYFD